MDERRMDLVDEGAVGITAALQMTGMGRSSLYVEMEKGEIPYIKIGRRRMVPLRALKEFLAKRLVGGQPSA